MTIIKRHKAAYSICVQCGAKYPLDTGLGVRCGSCQFIHQYVRPMLDRFAPGAIVQKGFRDGHYVMQFGNRYCPFWTDGFDFAPEKMQDCIGLIYERVRKLSDPLYIFDWQSVADIDEKEP